MGRADLTSRLELASWVLKVLSRAYGVLCFRVDGFLRAN
jgi:hypothetical protein